MLLAAMHPEAHIPDTPARKVRCCCCCCCLKYLFCIGFNCCYERPVHAPQCCACLLCCVS
jgi:hypothetical protein